MADIRPDYGYMAGLRIYVRNLVGPDYRMTMHTGVDESF